MDCVACRVEALERVEVETREVEVLGTARRVEGIQSTQDSALQLGVDLRRPAGLPQLGKAFVLERPDHGFM